MKFLFPAALSACIVISACSPTPVQEPLSGGGNDFPNPAVFGQMITENLSKADSWSDSVSVIPASSPVAVMSSVSVPSTASSGLAKGGSASLTRHVDWSDTVHGIVRIYFSFVSDTIIFNDTSVFLYDDAFRDSIKNNDHAYLRTGSLTNNKLQARLTYRCMDADGDSIINNRDGNPNRVVMSVSTSSMVGATQTAILDFDGGKDGNLDTKADNRIFQCQALQLSQEGDTASLVAFEPYSGDSAIIDASRTDSCFVRARLFNIDTLLHRTSAEAVFIIFPADSAKNRVVYFNGTTVLNSNVTVAASLRRACASGDSLFFSGDTVCASIVVESRDGIINADTLRLFILCGPNAAGPNNGYLLGLYRHAVKNDSADRHCIFSLTCNELVGPKEKPQSGSFSLNILYSDDQWIAAQGSFTPTEITALLEHSTGSTKQLAWDRNGKPKE